MTMRFLAAVLAVEFMFGGAAFRLRATEKAAYPARAPVSEYLISDQNAEIALARSAAPKLVSDAAEVMVLAACGYTTAAKGGNGFVCIVERGWGSATDDAGFWNPKIRAPICFNAAAARTCMHVYLLKTRLVLEGKPRAEIARAMAAAFEKKELFAPGSRAMCYMMSRRQCLGDRDKSWHPHLMFFVPGDAGKTWGANLAGSPVMAANDPEERMTIMMVWAGEWSDGTGVK